MASTVRPPDRAGRRHAPETGHPDRQLRFHAAADGGHGSVRPRSSSAARSRPATRRPSSPSTARRGWPWGLPAIWRPGRGFSGLVADDETSLYDSLIFALYYLGGAAGAEGRAPAFRRPGPHQRLPLRGRPGVRPPGRHRRLHDRPRPAQGRRPGRLAKLAAETGGRSFFARRHGGAHRRLRGIEHDLRSRYRISYQSSNTRPDDAFRTVRVQVGKPGLEARTISGYYPYPGHPSLPRDQHLPRMGCRRCSQT